MIQAGSISIEYITTSKGDIEEIYIKIIASNTKYQDLSISKHSTLAHWTAAIEAGSMSSEYWAWSGLTACGSSEKSIDSAFPSLKY